MFDRLRKFAQTPPKSVKTLMTTLCASVLLAACAAPGPTNSRASSTLVSLPPVKTFTSVSAAQDPARRPNADIARDFLDLHFQLETGTALPAFTRFEGPINLRVLRPNGATNATWLDNDLSHLLARLRREAGINITRVDARQDARITVELVPAAELARRAPNTACIVAPNVTSWAEFKRARRADLSWTTVTTRERLSIFLPAGEAPQEMRDCLHEEIAQALGPLNDLYRLPDSVFNDDNIHSVLTGFDMLILRASYAPELRSGMSRQAVAQALPGILARLNPRGAGRTGQFAPATPDDWRAAVETAMGPGAVGTRVGAAERAVALAQRNGLSAERLGFSWFLLGRLSSATNKFRAIEALEAADRIYGASPLTRYHAAHVGLQISALALAEKDYQRAYERAARAIPAARDAQNAALLSSLMLTEAEALAGLGRLGEARQLRLDSLGWARYGFGSDAQVRARVDEIATLAR